MAIVEQIRADLTDAMRGGEKDKVGALRLVLSELQKASKEGSDDELAVLRRERKRRLEAAKAFRDGGRVDLAEGEEAEGELISAYMPAALSDAELDALIAEAISATGATSIKDMGKVMGLIKTRAQGRADMAAVGARIKARLA